MPKCIYLIAAFLCCSIRLSKKSFVGFNMARDEGRPLGTSSLGRPLRGLAKRSKRSTCSKSTVPSKQVKSFLLLKSKLASYLAKCTILACRKGIVVWKIHVFTLIEKGPVDCFKGHPTLKRGIAIKNGLLSHT